MAELALFGLRTYPFKSLNELNNNIYGSNNPTNIGVGSNIQQTISNYQLTEKDIKLLSDYGVEQAEIENLIEIIKNYSKDKPSLTAKAMKWLGSVSASVAAKGFYDNIPHISDFIGKLIQ